MKIFIYFALGFLILFSCKKEDKAYTGPVMVEFSQTAITKTISYVEHNQYKILIPVQIVGPIQTTNTTVVVSAFSADSSAKEGTHFSLNKSITIPAGEISANVEVLINSDKVTNPLNFEVTIVEGGTFKASENYKQAKLTISKQTFLEFFTGDYSCTEIEFQNHTYNTTFYKSEIPNSIYTKNFWDFAQVGQRVTFTLMLDNSKKIIISSQTFICKDESKKPYTLTGNGTFDNTGKMKIHYELENADAEKDTGTIIYTPKR